MPVLPVTLLYLGSTATASGTAFGIKFKTGSMVAAYIIILSLLHLMLPAPSTRTVHVAIRNQGSAIRKPFAVMIEVPNRGLVERKGDLGVASVERDSSLDAIRSLTVECAGYETKSIEDATIPLMA